MTVCKYASPAPVLPHLQAAASPVLFRFTCRSLPLFLSLLSTCPRLLSAPLHFPELSGCVRCCCLPSCCVWFPPDGGTLCLRLSALPSYRVSMFYSTPVLSDLFQPVWLPSGCQLVSIWFPPVRLLPLPPFLIYSRSFRPAAHDPAALPLSDRKKNRRPVTAAASTKPRKPCKHWPQQPPEKI